MQSINFELLFRKQAFKRGKVTMPVVKEGQNVKGCFDLPDFLPVQLKGDVEESKEPLLILPDEDMDFEPSQSQERKQALLQKLK
jgi:hypothetical protein